MSDIAVKFENISKQYRLGKIGTGTLSHDLKRWWTVNVRGKADPYLKIGSVNDRSIKGDTDYVWALRDINLEVRQGEVLGIIGKNGAGKSTLLKSISRVTTPTTGTIKARGRIASLLEVGPGFHPEMTGRENIFMNGSIMGMTKAEIIRKFDEIVDFAGVAKYIDTPVKRYSSGMTVRLGFAIAAHLEPEILVVDEVLAVGDAEFQQKAIGKMQDVSQSEGRTVLFVSHNMSSMRSLCKNGIILKNGTISYAGDISSAVTLYLENETTNTLNYINNIAYQASYIKLKTISINNKQAGSVQLMDHKNIIEIEIAGELFIETKMAFELRLLDKLNMPLAFYSPGHFYGKAKDFKVGNFHIEEKIFLPEEINRGTYRLDISLTIPGSSYHVSIKGIFIEIEGFPTKTGWVFDYDKGAGFILIK